MVVREPVIGLLLELVKARENGVVATGSAARLRDLPGFEFLQAVVPGLLRSVQFYARNAEIGYVLQLPLERQRREEVNEHLV